MAKKLTVRLTRAYTHTGIHYYPGEAVEVPSEEVKADLEAKEAEFLASLPGATAKRDGSISGVPPKNEDELRDARKQDIQRTRAVAEEQGEEEEKAPKPKKERDKSQDKPTGGGTTGPSKKHRDR